MTGSEAAAAYGAIVGEQIPRIGDSLVCAICDKPVTDVASHAESLSHMLAAERQPLKVPVYYGVAGRGRDMLERNGWKEGMGLGSREQGRPAPLRAVEKQDRLGIGLKRKGKPKAKPEPQEKLRGSAHVRRGKAYEAQKGQWQTVYGALSDLSGDPVV